VLEAGFLQVMKILADDRYGASKQRQRAFLVPEISNKTQMV
jgi:hypothetical protein